MSQIERIPEETQRAFAVDVVRQLRDAGHEALWAGGCVRDQLLGHVPKDYDVATSARPEQIREIFGKRRTLPIGAAFGVISVLGNRECDPIEVATFRCDGKYLDGRRPTEVTFTDSRHDAARRDFTINGLFFDPLAGQVIDYVGGQDDLQAGVVRAIGDPHARFDEDKLRMLRAVRFAATFGFSIDAATFAAICEMADQIKVVSAERIGMELRRMLVHRARSRAIALLAEAGLLDQVVFGWAAARSMLDPTLATLDRLQAPSLPLAFAALVSPLGPPDMATKLARELRFTRKEGELTRWLLTHIELVGQAESLPWPVVQRILIQPAAGELVALYEAQRGGADSGSNFCRAKLALPTAVLNPLPLVDGADLLAQGVRSGPGFAALLERLRNAQLEGRIVSRAEALALASKLVASDSDAN